MKLMRLAIGLFLTMTLMSIIGIQNVSAGSNGQQIAISSVDCCVLATSLKIRGPNHNGTTTTFGRVDFGNPGISGY